MAKPDAIYVDCPGVTNDGAAAHDMRDGCYSCAPFWARIPICPVHGRKLATSGHCKPCRKFYSLDVDDKLPRAWGATAEAVKAAHAV